MHHTMHVLDTPAAMGSNNSHLEKMADFRDERSPSDPILCSGKIL